MKQQDFQIRLEIYPRVPQNDELFKSIYPAGEPENAHIEPPLYYPAIMSQTRREAAERFGPELREAPASL